MKNAYSTPTLREMSAEEIKQKLDALDLGSLTKEELLDERPVKPASIANMLRESEKPDQSLWMQIYRGGASAILAAREILSRGSVPSPRLAFVSPVSRKDSVKYVICTRDHVWWLTSAGAAQHAADEAMLFSSEMEAEKEKSKYLRVSAGGPQFMVQEIGI